MCRRSYLGHDRGPGHACKEILHLCLLTPDRLVHRSWPLLCGERACVPFLVVWKCLWQPEPGREPGVLARRHASQRKDMGRGVLIFHGHT